jgi:hypothetical protein
VDARAITAIPAVADSTARAAQAALDPDLAYGPDDPGYGPPGPDWYRRDPEEPVVAEPVTTPVPADVTPAAAVPIRSPFEPLARSSAGSWSTEAGRTSAGQADDGHAARAYAVPEYAVPEYAAAEHAEHAEHEDYELSAYPSAGYESPGIDDFDLAGSDDDDALGQLRYLYASAERMGAETTEAGGTDSQLGQLLDKQRKLISEYFKESGSLPEGATEVSDLRGAR